MKRQRLKKYLEAIDLHDEKARKWAIYGCFGLLFVLSIVIRKGLIHYQNGDFLVFINWYNFAKAHGFHSFKYGYSNYNPPFTYFIYIATLLPISKVVALKGIMAAFDVILAVAVYFAVKVFRPQGNTPLVAALTTMFLPTVLVTGVMWGQFDQLYIAGVVFSLYAGLRNNSRWAWIWFGIAIAVKFQAIFFLPVLLIMIFKRIRWYDAIWAVGAFLVLTLPPMIAGRSLHSLLNIYPAQAQVGSGYLTLNAPNLYQWFPASYFPLLYHLGIGVAVAACLFILVYTLEHKKFSKAELLLCTSLVLYVVPFLLPEMHERYFFPATIGSLILAFAYPTKLYAGIAVVAQVVVIFSYGPFLFGYTPVPFTYLALAVLAIICALASKYFMLPKTELIAKTST
ncbi:MAG TPA: glycosyltransferase 87 family protein [Candidatus Saccharimonadales bacterium]|nr:glycosyltransferase 87 family protein [Candidatus Saccharimonadales bacterium]